MIVADARPTPTREEQRRYLIIEIGEYMERGFTIKGWVIHGSREHVHADLTQYTRGRAVLLPAQPSCTTGTRLAPTCRCADTEAASPSCLSAGLEGRINGELSALTLILSSIGNAESVLSLSALGFRKYGNLANTSQVEVEAIRHHHCFLIIKGL